jgi:hypothetical protein
MLFPACTGTGPGVFVTDRSAEFPTVILTVALLLPLLGSEVVEATESVCVMIVPDATPALTVTTKLKFAVVVAAMVAVSVHFRVASTQVQPAGPVKDTAVVFAGSVSVRTGAFAVAGPEFVTLCVYVMLLPAETGFGVPVFVTTRSAWVADATAMFTVAELLPGLVSRELVDADSVSVMIVPAAVPAVTL